MEFFNANFYISFIFLTRVHVPRRYYCAMVLYICVYLYTLYCCCWYRSDRYRRFEDKMDNENDSLWAHIYTHSEREPRGRKIIIIAKEHITRRRAGRAKCLTRARMQITRTTRRGRKCIQPKRVGLFFYFLFTVHKK